MTAADLAKSGILIRPATLDDIDTMVTFRVRMFREMGWSDESRIDAFIPAATTHLREGFSAGTLQRLRRRGDRRIDGDRRIIGDGRARVAACGADGAQRRGARRLRARHVRGAGVPPSRNRPAR